MDTGWRLVGSAALVIVAALVRDRPVLATYLAMTGLASSGVASYTEQGRAVAISAWLFAAVLAVVLLLERTRGWTAAGVGAAVACASLAAFVDMPPADRLLQASQAVFAVASLGAAAAFARTNDALLAVGIAAYPGAAAGVGLVSAAWPVALVAALGALGAWAAWVFLARRPFVGLAIAALPLAGMLGALVGVEAALGFARAAGAALILAAMTPSRPG